MTLSFKRLRTFGSPARRTPAGTALTIFLRNILKKLIRFTKKKIYSTERKDFSLLTFYSTNTVGHMGNPLTIFKFKL